MLNDVSVLKANLRKKYSDIRKNINKKNKKLMDNLILQNLLVLPEIKTAKTILTYLSFNHEPDTFDLINKFENKMFAAPVCNIEKNEIMFYSFKNLSELSVNNWGILEPPKLKQNIAYTHDSDVCIVPGLCFDLYGNRLGYGKGFYDYFFEKTNILKIGLCYSNCITNKLPHDKFDIPVNIVVTENFVKYII